MVWKFGVFSPSGDVTVDVPRGAEIKATACNGGALSFWAVVDPNAPTEPRRFRIFGTGWSVEPGYTYIGTGFDGPFVWHLFENVR